MSNRTSVPRLFALVVGATLVAAGVIGFLYESAFSSDESVRDAVFGVLDVNGWHNLVHLATGLVALAMAGRRPVAFALGFGVVYLAVAVWGFLVGDGGSILSIVPVNTEDNVLHLVLGLSGLAVYAMVRGERRSPASPLGTTRTA
jgi:hypothetical protein